MIEYSLDTTHSVLYLQLKSALEQEDFVKVAKIVDPTLKRPASLPASSWSFPRFQDGKISEQWPPTSASYGTITSASRKSVSSPIPF